MSDLIIIDLRERATAANFFVAANNDIMGAVKDRNLDPLGHFRRHGENEGRMQIRRDFFENTNSFLSQYRKQKFERFCHALRPDFAPMEDVGTFPVIYGKAQFKLNDYVAESSNCTPNFFEQELERNSSGLFADIGAGFRNKLYSNCLYLEVYPGRTVDVVFEPGEPIPLQSNSLDGLGCFSVLEHVPQPWMLARELVRVVKPGGKLMIDYPFLQPFHGYPNHYFNATREGLRTLFENDVEIVEISTRGYQGPDHTLAWILRGIINAVQDEQLKQEIMSMSVAELVAEQPQSALYRRVLSTSSPAARMTFSCGNTLIGVKKG